MAEFLVQNDKGSLEDEERFIVNRLKYDRYMHSYKSISLDEIKKIIEKGLYPVGTIDFVTTYLNNAYGIKNENPIEVPKYLRTEEFLKRDYYFAKWDELPRHGRYFLKDASELKNFGMVINAEYFITDELFNYEKQNKYDSTLVLPKNHIYLVSSVFNIKSEYRVYVLQHEIEAIVCYNGDCTVLPDLNLIKKAVAIISCYEEWLRSYTIDIMVGDTGTSIIEIHNFASVGLYQTLWGSSLPWAYKDGIDYLIHDNKELEI